MSSFRLFTAFLISVCLCAALSAAPWPQQPTVTAAAATSAQLDALKRQAATDIDGMAKFTQQTTDLLFSFSELGFQEFETSKYIVRVLRENGFTVQEGVYGFPTGWTASWGSGKPIVALSADLDCLPEASQKPGVAYHDPIMKADRATVKATTPDRRFC